MTPVRFSPAAERQAEAIQDWWEHSRPAAPALFVEELATAIATLAATPEIGARVRVRGVPSVRRLLLRATRHHVYYLFDGEIVHVLAVWHTARGRGPDLRRLIPRS